jgi:N-acetylmuramoyl-L-alanine amidase
MKNFLSWLLGLFSKKTPTNNTKPSEPFKPEQPVDPIVLEPTKPTEPIEPNKPIVKIALIVGHTPKAAGAINYKGEREFTFNSRIAALVEAQIRQQTTLVEVKTFFRDEGSFAPAVAKVGKAVGDWGAKASLELHFNSFDQPAFGCEVLVWQGAKQLAQTVAFADAMTNRFSQQFGIKQRGQYVDESGKRFDGVRVLTTQDRGALNLKACCDQGVALVLLIEPCFANIETAESRAVFENELRYAQFIAQELIELAKQTQR